MTHPKSQDFLGSQIEDPSVYLGVYVADLFNALDKAMMREVVPRGVAGLEYSLLWYCLERERTATQLAQILPVDGSRISRVVTVLVEKGLLSRRRLRNDRRVVMLGLTEEGTDAFTVKVGGAERAVSGVSVDSSAVTLTLDSPVTAGQTVTVSYARGGASESIKHANRDKAHFAADLTDRAVTNVTNRPSSGVPIITGTPQVGETLTADTSGIADADGMNNVTFSYQWVASDESSDTDIAGATNSTYILLAEEEGKSIKVRVSFTDDSDNDETLTSDATAAVAVGEVDVIWSVEMLVKDYGNGSVGAYGADLFSNETGSLRIKWLWYHEPSRKLYLAFGDAVADSEYLTLQVSDVSLGFPSGDSSFRFKGVDVTWTAGQTLAVRIVRQGESDAS